jgi:hypothetical protein
MDQLLQGLSGVQCVLDGMIITGKSDDEHLHSFVYCRPLASVAKKCRLCVEVDTDILVTPDSQLP